MGFPAAVRWRHCSRIRKTRSRKSKRCPIGYCTRLNSVHEHGLCRRERHSYVITHLYILSTNVFTTIWRLFLQPCKSDTQILRCLLSSPFNTGYFDKQSLYSKINQLFKFKRKQNPPLYFTAIHWNYVFNVHLYVKFNVKQLKCDILKKILTSFWQYYYTCKAQMHYMKKPPFVMLIMNLSVNSECLSVNLPSPCVSGRSVLLWPGRKFTQFGTIRAPWVREISLLFVFHINCLGWHKCSYVFTD